MDADREYVEARWKGAVAVASAVGVWISGEELALSNFEKNEADAWSAAKAFTVERERQIAEQIVDVERVKRCAAIYEHESYRGNNEAKASWNRILSREQEWLTVLKQGMKQ